MATQSLPGYHDLRCNWWYFNVAAMLDRLRPVTANVSRTLARHQVMIAGARTSHTCTITGGGDSETAPDHVQLAFHMKL